MLRKRARPAHSQQMADSSPDSSFSSGAVTPKGRGSSFFSVPGLLVGLSSKGSSDSDSARSPTSPLESRDSQMECDDYSGSVPIPIDSSRGLIESLSASEIELSEDYTCIISHGPNPKTTHIFGDRIFEAHTIQSPSSLWMVECSEDSLTHPSDEFLNLCFSCKKKLEGEDIYIYRGEKAFCSGKCRDKEILIEEEEKQKSVTESADSPHLFSDEEMYLGGVA